ncbi:MAG: hypothetical protein KDC05_09245 [Bacteroidales bacterium]|nr:hypothetical protein [Bacteroidales bacterium]
MLLAGAMNINLFAAGLNSGENDLPKESVTISVDRDLYFAGETIWFSAGCEIENHNNQRFSNILYVELFQADNKIISQEKFYLHNGIVTGFIQIPDELPTSSYFIRAYTRYMRNFDPHSYAYSVITVINPELPGTQSKIINDIEIFTGFGKLMQNIPNPVTFFFPKGDAKDFQRIAITGSAGIKYSDVHVLSSYLASSVFTPVDTTVYFLEAINGSGDSISLAFPASESGVAVTASDLGQEYLIKLYGNIQSVEFDGPLSVLIWSQDRDLVFTQKWESESLLNGIRISGKSLPEGMLTLHVEAPGNPILAKTTFFVFAQEASGPEIAVSQNSCKPGDKLFIDFDTATVDLSEIKNLQLKVVKAGSVNWLSSGLPAQLIKNPFLLRDAIKEHVTKDITRQVDAVMNMASHALNSTNKASGLKENKSLGYLPDIRDVSLVGLVNNGRTGQPAGNVRIYVSVLSDKLQLHTSTTGPDGTFFFSLPHLKGNHDLFVCTKTDTLQNYNILLQNDFSPDFIPLVDQPQRFDTSDRQLLESILLGSTASDHFASPVKIETSPLRAIPDWFGGNVETFVLSDYIAMSSIQEVFNEIVTWVKFRKRGGRYQLTVFDNISQITYNDPLVLVDGIPVTDPSALIGLFPAQIDRISVFNKTYLLGDYTIRGLIFIQTKTDNFGNIPLPENAIFVNYKHRTLPAEFIPPDSATLQLQPSHVPWFSNLLFFRDYTTPQELQRAGFYVSDDLCEYDVILTGETNEGEKIYSKTSFSVVR